MKHHHRSWLEQASFGLRTATRSAPLAVTVDALGGAILSAVPSLNIIAVAYTVNKISERIAKGSILEGSTPLDVIWPLIALAAITHVTSSVRSLAQSKISLFTEMRLRADLSRALTGRRLAELENAELQDEVQLANLGAGGRIAAIYQDCLVLASGMIAFVSVAYVLLSWDIMVALAIVVSPLPSLAANLLYSRIGWDLEVEQAGRRRYIEYLRALLTDPRRVPELITARSRGAIVQTAQDLDTSLVSDKYRLARRRVMVTSAVGIASVLGLGVAFVSAAAGAVRTGDVGTFAGFLSATATMQGTLFGITQGFVSLSDNVRYAGAFTRVVDGCLVDLVNCHDGGRVVAEDRERPIQADGLRFRDVYFAYPERARDTLKGISFEVPAARAVYLCGENGSGKSTLGKLAAGLYEPKRGEAILDGLPCFESVPLDAVSLPSRVGVLHQRPLEFEASLRMNVTLGDQDISDDEVLRALRTVGLSSLVSGPAALERQLGRLFNGTQLSTGQWQRLGLARIMVGNYRLIILDEPTSAIDECGLDMVREFISELERSGRIVLVITHDEELIPAGGEVIRIEGGRISHIDLKDEAQAIRSVLL